MEYDDGIIVEHILVGASVPVHNNYTAPSEAINQISDVCKQNMLKKNLDQILNTNGNTW